MLSSALPFWALQNFCKKSRADDNMYRRFTTHTHVRTHTHPTVRVPLDYKVVPIKQSKVYAKRHYNMTICSRSKSCLQRVCITKQKRTRGNERRPPDSAPGLLTTVCTERRATSLRSANRGLSPDGSCVPQAQSIWQLPICRIKSYN